MRECWKSSEEKRITFGWKNQENIAFDRDMEERQPEWSKCIDTNLSLAKQRESQPLRKVSESPWTESERGRYNVNRFCPNFQLIQKWSLKSLFKWVPILVLYHSDVGQFSNWSTRGCVRPRWEHTGNHTGGRFVCACSEWGKIFLQLSPEIWEEGIWGRENGVSQSTPERKYRAHPRKTQSKGWLQTKGWRCWERRTLYSHWRPLDRGQQ